MYGCRLDLIRRQPVENPPWQLPWDGTPTCRRKSAHSSRKHTDRPSQLSNSQAGKNREAQRSGPRPVNEVFALLDKTGTGQCPVAVHRHVALHSRCLWLRPVHQQRRLQLGRDRPPAVLLVTSTAFFPAAPAVEGA